MEELFIEEQKFTGTNYSGKRLEKTVYENCEFINCDFTKCEIPGSDFIDCIFTECNMSLIVTKKTGLKGVQFRHCKLTGILFGDCSDFLFSVSFSDCILDYSSFYRRKMKKTTFFRCSLKEVDFEEADLTETIFDDCDLGNAIFLNSILEKTDFRNARDYIIDPGANRMKKARFSLAGLPGLLNKYDILIDP